MYPSAKVGRPRAKSTKVERPEAKIEADVIDIAIECRKKGGRPLLLNLDKQHTFETRDLLHRLAEIQCTHPEAARIFGVNPVTFDRWLWATPEAEEIWQDGQKQGQMSLRRAQYHAAIKGNVVMMIWLGKNLLGQK